MLASESMRAAAHRWSPLVAALVLSGAALFFGGGSGDGSLPWLGGGAIVVVLVFAATRPVPGGLLAFAPLALLAVWSAVSVAWSIEPDRSWSYANRGLVYLAFALVGAFAADRLKELMYGFAALLGAVCAWTLAGKALPWLYEDYERVARLRAPIGYWNALALLGAVALPIGLCLATRRRVPGTLLVFGWMVALALTYSRGGVIVAVLAVAAWIALSRAWAEALATLVAAGLPAAVVIGIALTLDGVTKDGQSHSTRVSDGAIFGLVVLAGLGAAALLARIEPPEPTDAVRRAALALVAVVAAAVIVVGAVHARSWWDSFTSPTVAELPNSPNRFTEAGAELPLDVVEPGLARLEGASRRRHRRRLVPLHEPALPHDERRPDDRAAQPARAVPDRDGRRRAAAVRRRGARPRRRRATPGGAAARPRAGPAHLPRARPDRHRLGLRRRQRAGLPDGGRRRRAARAGAAAVGLGGRSWAPASRSPWCARSSLCGSATGGRRRRASRSTGRRARSSSRSARARSTRLRWNPSSPRPTASGFAATPARRWACSARRRRFSRTTPRPGTSSASSTCASATARGRRSRSSTASRSSNPQDPQNKEYDRALKLVNSGTPIC